MITNELARDIKREVLKHNYFEFFKWAFEILHPGTKYSDNFHVKYLCDILQEEAERILNKVKNDKDILINIPPRTSKSLIVSVCFLPWVWLRDPSKKFICISFDDQLALLNSQYSRDIIAHLEYQELFSDCFTIRSDIDSKGYFANNFGGYRLSRSSGTNVTGYSADYILVDDPDSATKVNSQSERTKVHNFYFSGLYNRLTPPDLGIRVVLQQRLHEEDLTGVILSKQSREYRHICLPAELTPLLKPAELAEFYTDGLLDPKRLGKDTLASFKLNLGSKGYTGQYLQAPAPDEGGIFKKEWFDIIPATSIVRDSVNNPIMFILDTAYTEKQTNDPSAILSCFVRDNTLYIIDAHEVWMEFPQLVQHLISHTSKYGYTQNSKIYVEPKASGKSLVQQIRISTALNIIELNSTTDSKVTRANSIAPICESRRVKLVDGAYTSHFLDQVTTFPHAAKDDMLDTMVYAVQRLLQKDNSPDIAFLSF